MGFDDQRGLKLLHTLTEAPCREHDRRAEDHQRHATELQQYGEEQHEPNEPHAHRDGLPCVHTPRKARRVTTRLDAGNKTAGCAEHLGIFWRSPRFCLLVVP